MKKPSIFLWFLLPMLIGVLLLPPISYSVFHRQAEQQALAMAEKDLGALQNEISQLAAEMLPESVSPRETRIQPFLRNVSSTISKTVGSARLLLFADQDRLIYPPEEESASVLALASVVAENLHRRESNAVVQVQADGESYLLYISPSPVQTKRLTYLVTYCPIASIGTWVANAGRTVLLLSLGVSLIFALLVFLLVHRLTRSLQTVEQAAQQIQSKQFVSMDRVFPAKELESLRLSVNAMSDQLKNADRKEKTFFQNISHELRTPLMSIGGYAQGIEQGVFSDEKEAARIILSESERLTEMVKGLLTLSKLDRKDESPTFAALTISELTGPAMDRIAGVALQKGIWLEQQDDTDGMSLTTDAKRVGLILDNLLSNGVRYAKTVVRIGATVSEDLVVLTVSDDGSGIDKEDLPYIFDRCYTGKGGNNGVGLALAKAAAESIGAELTAENGEKGAVFRLTLPL